MPTVGRPGADHARHPEPPAPRLPASPNYAPSWEGEAQAGAAPSRRPYALSQMQGPGVPPRPGSGGSRAWHKLLPLDQVRSGGCLRL